jgi:hypothetical protein
VGGLAIQASWICGKHLRAHGFEEARHRARPGGARVFLGRRGISSVGRNEGLHDFHRRIGQLHAVRPIAAAPPKRTLRIGSVGYPFSICRIGEIGCRVARKDWHELTRSEIIANRQYAAWFQPPARVHAGITARHRPKYCAFKRFGLVPQPFVYAIDMFPAAIGCPTRHRQLLERKGFSRDFQQGFGAMISGQTAKVILDWTHIA